MLQTADLLRIFHAHRGDAIVVPGRGGRHWGKISTRPSHDLPMGDPAMGGHAGFALGIALALPQNKVVLFDSEGDLLMSLGILLIEHYAFTHWEEPLRYGVDVRVP